MAERSNRKRKSHHRAHHRGSLVKRLLDNPQLPAFVAQLQAPRLHALVQHVGKEDAQELMVLASPEQMRELLALDVWQVDGPGTAEQFDPRRFLEWLQVWRDMDSAFMVRKLREVGSELLSATLLDYVVVVDLEAVGVDGEVEVFANYGVMPQDNAPWPELFELLTEIFSQDPELVLDILGRCCLRRSLRDDTAGISAADLAVREDLAGEHEDLQMQRGYVSPLQAALLLGDAKGAALEQLIIEVSYDQISALHLRRVQRQRDVELNTPVTDETPTAAPRANDTDPDWQDLEALLGELDSPTETTYARLPAPERADGQYLSEALRELAVRDTNALAARQDELVFLANVLLVGTHIQGEPCTRSQAAEAAHALCNLGLVFCVREEAWDEPEVVRDSFLLHTPGLVKAFRIGYHLVGQVTQQALNSLARVLARPQVERRLHAHVWLAERVAELLQILDQAADLKEGDLAQLPQILERMALIFDSTRCQQLRVLSDGFPCYPNSLDPNKQSLTVDKTHRFIDTPQDLQQIHTCLSELRL